MLIYTYIIETSQVTHVTKMVDTLEEIYGKGRFGVQSMGPRNFRIKVTTFDPKAPWEKLRAMGMVCQALQIDGGIVHKTQ